ncbi:hypothetical protein [Sorangium sp. So ce854]|uniref:hypothetical protein n=1 Tax=Sorangium sp. So ce854 TaxID=3133322 RepID=UPI003F5E4B03
MKPSSDVTGLYRNFPAYLWVEDEETRTYLQAVWEGESHIKVLVAGGHGYLHAVVNAARNDYNTHVFGFRDRDFGVSNRARWNDHTVVVLTADVVEIENLLLDPDAIAACQVNTARHDARKIEQELTMLATPLTWWMSCRRTITEIRDAVVGDFLEHPGRDRVRTQGDAEAAITGSPWWARVLPTLQPDWGNAATITRKLQDHEASYRAMLSTGAWRREFSGKEILRELTTRIWTRKRPKDPECRLTFVQEIARAQRELNRVPQEIRELRTSIRRRIGH